MTPQRILDLVRREAQKAIGASPLAGHAIIMTDRFSSDAYGCMLMPRGAAIAAFASSIPNEVLDKIRDTPSHRIPVIYWVENHRGVLYIEPLVQS